MREKAARYGRPRFGDKTPGHVACLSDIFRDFPDARVIHTVRDPRDTVPSLQRMPWMPPNLVSNALYLADERNLLARFRRRVLEVRLEDLLADPRSTMARVLEYIGEPWDDAVLDHVRSAPDDNDIPPMPWHELATRDRAASPVRRGALSPLQIRMIELLAWRTMKEVGYERAQLAHEPSRLAVYWAVVRELPESIRGLVYGMRFGWMMRRNPAALDQAENRAMMRGLNPWRGPSMQAPNCWRPRP